MLLSCCSSSIFSFVSLERSTFASFSRLDAIYQRKYFNLLDSYFNLPKFSYKVLTSPGYYSFFKRQSRDPCVFLTVSLTSFDTDSFSFSGLQKEMDFLKLDLNLACGRLACIEFTISLISFSRGLEIGAISDRLKAPIIFNISLRLTSEFCFLYYLVYSSKQLAIILKSSILDLIFQLKSPADCFLLVIFELDLCFDSSIFFPKFITLIVCLLFFFLFQPCIIVLFALLSFVEELLQWPT